MKYCVSCRSTGTWGCARLCVALKMYHDMGNLWTNYWKSVNNCFIQSAQIIKCMDPKMLQFK